VKPERLGLGKRRKSSGIMQIDKESRRKKDEEKGLRN
jgi:hypothetical protein